LQLCWIRQNKLSSSKPLPILTESEIIVLNELISDREIVIKLADKGGGICIQDAVKYRQEMISQLSNTRFYKKINNDPTIFFQTEIVAYLEDAKKQVWISESEFQVFILQEPYTLPKVHKCLTNPAGRPKMALTDSIWSPLSKFDNCFIKP
uniref:Uncharacterized protein n=1 Tax=Labrus bergylta TaxID=56723 RepID=A0A3Q3GVP1_9LABR